MPDIYVDGKKYEVSRIDRTAHGLPGDRYTVRVISDGVLPIESDTSVAFRMGDAMVVFEDLGGRELDTNPPGSYEHTLFYGTENMYQE